MFDGGNAALWEWCHKTHYQNVFELSALPQHDWGAYSQEQNETIEQAFQAGDPEVDIDVGIRQYQIVFGPETGFARQIDSVLRKRRAVRRRLVSQTELQQSFSPEVGSFTRQQQSCALCFEEFEETAHLPTLELPGCHHAFHFACIQQIRDTGGPCPICRAHVDWTQLASSSMTRRRRNPPQ